MNNKYLQKIASDLSIAKKSKGEEEKAIVDYTERLKEVKSPELRKAIEHARSEERDHAEGFKKVMEKEAEIGEELKSRLGVKTKKNRYLKKYLLKIARSETTPTQLSVYQERALKKLEDNSGVLLDHSMGSGKTKTMLVAIERAQKRDKKNDALAIVPSSLLNNLDEEIKKHNINIDRSRLNVTTYDRAVNNAAELRKKHHSIVVVDESHRLRNCNTQRHKELRGIIEEADQRVLATGTSRYNHVSDMAPLINMVARKKVLPEGKKEFDKEFVSTKTERPGILAGLVLGASPEETKTLKNNKYLKKVLDRHVDYYDAKTDPEAAKHFPKSTEHHIEVELSPEQRAMYKYMEGKLPWTTKMRIRMNLPLDKKESANLNAFSSGLRQVSNTASPFMPNLQDTSPKIRTMVDRLEKRHKSDKKFKAIVHSNYMDAGLNEYSRELASRGIPHSIYHGGLSGKEKTEIKDAYNAGKTRVMLVSSSGAEGLNTTNTRLVQVMENHFNKSKTDQMVARGIRFKSHEGLPAKDRHVDVEYYHSVHPKGFFGKRPTSIDEYLWHHGKSKEDLGDQVVGLMND
jgi:SNF2 family DNA or RNA helicase